MVGLAQQYGENKKLNTKAVVFKAPEGGPWLVIKNNEIIASYVVYDEAYEHMERLNVGD